MTNSGHTVPRMNDLKATDKCMCGHERQEHDKGALDCIHILGRVPRTDGQIGQRDNYCPCVVFRIAPGRIPRVDLVRLDCLANLFEPDGGDDDGLMIEMMDDGENRAWVSDDLCEELCEMLRACHAEIQLLRNGNTTP